MKRPRFLIDTNVLREMHRQGHANVRTWLKSIDDDQIFISPVVYREMREGRERQRQKLLKSGGNTTQVDAALTALDDFEKEFEDRQVPITFAIERVAAKMMGAKGKNADDVVLAATAHVHDLVIVSRNVNDFVGRGVKVLDPFKKIPKIQQV